MRSDTNVLSGCVSTLIRIPRTVIKSTYHHLECIISNVQSEAQLNIYAQVFMHKTLELALVIPHLVLKFEYETSALCTIICCGKDTLYCNQFGAEGKSRLSFSCCTIDFYCNFLDDFNIKMIGVDRN